jgi:predicted mannosyl-3-phosphoglycerate phosphatase (HAD superfamily)
MIVIKNSQLNNDSVAALNNLIEMDIKSAAAFRLMRVIKELSSLIEDKVKAEKRILDTYMEKDFSGNPIPVLNDDGSIIDGAVKIKDMDKFQKEMEELLSVETTINVDKIKFEDLGLETVKVKDLLKIDFIFE